MVMTIREGYGNTLEQQQEYVEKSQELFLKYTGRKACGMRPTGALLPETENGFMTAADFFIPAQEPAVKE